VALGDLTPIIRPHRHGGIDRNADDADEEDAENYHPWFIPSFADDHLAEVADLLPEFKSHTLCLEFGLDADVNLVHTADDVTTIARADFPIINTLHRFDEELTQFF
jgi:hypothetical protein